MEFVMGKNTILLFLFSFSLIYAEQTFVYPEGKLGDSVKLGEDILNHTDTNELSKNYVGSKLQCVNCHRKGTNQKVGTSKTIGTFIGTATAFPAYSKRYDDIISLQDRINGCFQRCLGGDKSVVGTKVGIAVESYITWLSKGMSIDMSTKAPRTPLKVEFWSKETKKFKKLFKKVTHQNYLNGKRLYEKKCASCHGLDGSGNGTFPPLWGKSKDGKWLSYTADGSMAKLQNGATWIQDNMPLNQPRVLSDDEVVDITLYIDAQPRASYNGFEVKDNFIKLGLDIDKIRGE
jgi:thiosulfate dehydrogenase